MTSANILDLSVSQRQKSTDTMHAKQRFRSLLLALCLLSMCYRIEGHEGDAATAFSSPIQPGNHVSSKNYNEHWKRQIGKLLNRDLQDALDLPLPAALGRDHTRNHSHKNGFSPAMSSSSKLAPKNRDDSATISAEVERFLKKSKAQSDAGVALGISSRGKGKGDKKNSKKSKSSKKSGSKSSKRGKGGKGGKGDNIFDNDDDDDNSGDDGHGYPSSPVATPTQAPAGGGGGGNQPTTGNTPTGNAPTGNAPTGNTPTGNTPTRNPTRPPSGGGGSPTPSPNTPTLAPASTAPVPEPPSNREPPSLAPGANPPPSSVEPRCTVNDNGVFGSQVGFSEEITFAYQVRVIPSVTAAELNLNALNSVETSMGDRILERLFDQCVPITSGIQRSSDETGGYGPPRNGNRERGYIYGSGGRARYLRALQLNDLEGFSTRPRDTVADGGKLFIF